MSAQIIPLPASNQPAQPATHQVTADTIIFTGQLLVALGQSMAGQPQVLNPDKAVAALILALKQTAQAPRS